MSPFFERWLLKFLINFNALLFDIIYLSSFYSLFTDVSNYLKVKFVIQQSKIRYAMYGSI